MLRFSFCIALVFAPALAHADEWHEVALYNCDVKADRLEIGHFGAYDEDGEALVKSQSGVQNLLSPVGPEDVKGSDWRVHRQCELSSGIYQIEVSPLKGFTNATAECAGWDSAQIRIELNGEEVLNIPFQRWCSSPDVVSAITIGGRTRHVVVMSKATCSYKWPAH